MASPIEIKVLSTTALKMVFEELAGGFERGTGNRLAVSLGPSLQLEKRLGEGEAADVAIVTRAGIGDLSASGSIVAGSGVDVARSSIGICVAKGAARPDLASVEGFKQALLAAKSVALSKPVGGGASGAHMAKVFAQLGISRSDASQGEIRRRRRRRFGRAGGAARRSRYRHPADVGIDGGVRH